MLVKQKKLKKGFTLAEMLIVLVIMMIIGATSIYIFMVASQRGKAAATAESLKSLIMQARNIAITGKDTNFNSGINWVRVRVDRNLKKASIYLDFNAGSPQLVTNSTINIDAEKIVFGKMEYHNGTAMDLCNKTTAQNVCNIYFKYQGLNPGEIDTFGVTALNLSDFEVYVVDNFYAGNPADVVAYSIKTNRYTGNVSVSKVDASTVR